ncbi:MarR family winged helix-turn-helix transcriptional regulator [Arthrobacter sp. 35W]|uniref:MarR family winged helix-turn-helix transcriptional regulator n=1 Tax=Arthrobacter sp. 35W TaxID=1132441 RepID=UPI00040FDE50|nr:MarR family transcriptional regulator [Arthrobacter sp. 35W]
MTSPASASPGGRSAESGTAAPLSPEVEAEAEVEADAEAAIDAVEEQLGVMWRRGRAINQNLARKVHPELEPAAYGLLMVLVRNGAMRLTDLAACIGVGKPSVSRQIAFLEQIGLVRKEADPSDGRAQSILLTEQGQARLRSVHQARKTALHARLADWSTAELEQFASLIAKLNQDYEQDFGPAEAHAAGK